MNMHTLKELTEIERQIVVSPPHDEFDEYVQIDQLFQTIKGHAEAEMQQDCLLYADKALWLIGRKSLQNILGIESSQLIDRIGTVIGSEAVRRGLEDRFNVWVNQSVSTPSVEQYQQSTDRARTIALEFAQGDAHTGMVITRKIPTDAS